jgi:copper chaperone
MKSVLLVEGMSCNHCVSSIEKALKSIQVKAKIDLANKTVSVEHDEHKVGLNTIKEAIEDQGYAIV